jgi:hypothetical protein
MAESSGTLVPKTLLGRVAFALELASTSAGGVVPTDVLSIEPGDLRELEFNGSAECWRLSCSFKSIKCSKRGWRRSYFDTSNTICQFPLVLCIFGI